MASTAAYTVKNVETAVKGTDVRVRLFTLAPGETIPWHFHRDSSDLISCLRDSFRSRPANPRLPERSPSAKPTRSCPEHHTSSQMAATRTAAFC